MKPGQRRIPHTKDSKRGKYPSHEAIILEGKPCYIYNGKNSQSFITVEAIEEETTVIRPPNAEEYPYTPYEFKDKQELDTDYYGLQKYLQLENCTKYAKNSGICILTRTTIY